MRTFHLAFLLITAAFALFVYSQNVESLADEEVSSSILQVGLAECDFDFQCASGQVCFAHVCVAGGGGGSPPPAAAPPPPPPPPPAFGRVSGTVTNITSPVESAVVTILGTSFSSVTAADGSYSIETVPLGTYDMLASKPSDGYEDSFASGVIIDLGGTTIQDFILLHPLGDCNDDCTKSDGLCRAECHGRGLCSFETPDTAAACDLAAPGLIDDPDIPGNQILCCSGASFAPVQANIEVCGDNVISIKRPVLFKGKLVNMVLTVFNAAECEN